MTRLEKVNLSDMLVWCPVVADNTYAVLTDGAYVCRRCEQVEGSDGSNHHGLPRL
jgi:hypothetical protein